MDEFIMCVSDNLGNVKELISGALKRSGRGNEQVTLIVVTKTQPVDRIVEAIKAGATDLGENYIQEAGEKIKAIGEAPRWHFIGHLQKNKARVAVELFDVIQSVDSIELAREIGRRAKSIDRTVDVLIEVNAVAEETKFGIAPDRALALADQISAIEGIRMSGIMGMAPFVDDPQEVRPVFRQLRQLWEKLPDEQRRFLSMGMSGDYEVAIEEGSNMVRIGSAIFGPRNHV